ncbi:MAG: hypothetical protein F6K24_21645 [Okeania sp. SIO2D1]|nr:hypothetical protein [Okeania sp. SIO4D6]NEP71438.1 hypothetical protein [Okeania sp. SIO2G5]NEP93443.1 hypothetical protein [Okeania sp. SIO2F5]NES67654.1 hypothetical protein [Okeania sp. SIO2D1]
MTNGQKLPSGLSVTVNDFSLKLNDTEIVESKQQFENSKFWRKTWLTI